MRYHAIDTINSGLNAVSGLMQGAQSIADSPFNPWRSTRLGRAQVAALETGSRLLRHYPKRTWGYPDVNIGGRLYPVTETVVMEKPFCKLMKFARAGLKKDAPKVLFVAAMSGHHATLSRETFGEFLPDHEVYVTDWTDAKRVPQKEGRFGFEEYIAYVIECLQAVGPETHMVCLCQAGVPGLAAAAIMSAAGDACRPSSIALLASPMDIRVNPNLLTAISRAISLRAVAAVAVHRVPARYPGRGRRVYPGMVQLCNFVALSLPIHIRRHLQFARDLYAGNFDAADKFRDFYDEYFSVLDSTAEFYIETLENVFVDQSLPKGLLMFKGKKVDCAAVTDIPLFTVEGAADNMVAIGQCEAAAAMCSNLPADKKENLVQDGVGHYGIFSGSKYRQHIAPAVQAFIARVGA